MASKDASIELGPQAGHRGTASPGLVGGCATLQPVGAFLPCLPCKLEPEACKIPLIMEAFLPCLPCKLEPEARKIPLIMEQQLTTKLSKINKYYTSRHKNKSCSSNKDSAQFTSCKWGNLLEM